MELHTLTPAMNALKKSKRKGRGQASGKGGTSTRGHKGAQSRSGYKRRDYAEGGQNPFPRRIAKHGFKNPNAISYQVLNLNDLEALVTKLKETTITKELLVTHNVIQKNRPYKVLGSGTLSKKIDVQATAFSKSARKAIEAQNGVATTLS